MILSSLLLTKSLHVFVVYEAITETKMSSFWWNFCHWLHWKLSKWWFPVQPVPKISSKWKHFCFSDQVLAFKWYFPLCCWLDLCICLLYMRQSNTCIWMILYLNDTFLFVADNISVYVCCIWGNQVLAFSKLRLRQNGRHFASDTLKCIFLNENAGISIKISPKFVPKGPLNNISLLVHIMAWHRPGVKPLSEAVVRLPTHICVTQPQWGKWYFPLCCWLDLCRCLLYMRLSNTYI